MRKELPPTYFLGAILVALFLHFFLPVRQLLTYPWRLVGLAPLAIGVLPIALAALSFKKHRTTIRPFEQSTSLVCFRPPPALFSKPL